MGYLSSINRIREAYTNGKIAFASFYQSPGKELTLYAYCIQGQNTLYFNRHFDSWYLGDATSGAVPFLYYHALHEWLHVCYPEYNENAIKTLVNNIYREDE